MWKAGLVLVVAFSLSGCATFWNDLSAAQDRYKAEHPYQPPVRQVSDDPLPNYYPSYSMPQVVQPQLDSPNVQHCNTIGYITTCQ